MNGPQLTNRSIGRPTTLVPLDGYSKIYSSDFIQPAQISLAYHYTAKPYYNIANGYWMDGVNDYIQTDTTQMYDLLDKSTTATISILVRSYNDSFISYSTPLASGGISMYCVGGTGTIIAVTFGSSGTKSFSTARNIANEGPYLLITIVVNTGENDQEDRVKLYVNKTRVSLSALAGWPAIDDVISWTSGYNYRLLSQTQKTFVRCIFSDSAIEDDNIVEFYRLMDSKYVNVKAIMSISGGNTAIYDSTIYHHTGILPDEHDSGGHSLQVVIGSGGGTDTILNSRSNGWFGLVNYPLVNCRASTCVTTTGGVDYLKSGSGLYGKMVTTGLAKESPYFNTSISVDIDYKTQVGSGEKLLVFGCDGVDGAPFGMTINENGSFKVITTHSTEEGEVQVDHYSSEFYIHHLTNLPYDFTLNSFIGTPFAVSLAIYYNRASSLYRFDLIILNRDEIDYKFAHLKKYFYYSGLSPLDDNGGHIYLSSSDEVSHSGVVDYYSFKIDVCNLFQSAGALLGGISYNSIIDILEGSESDSMAYLTFFNNNSTSSNTYLDYVDGAYDSIPPFSVRSTSQYTGNTHSKVYGFNRLWNMGKKNTYYGFGSNGEDYVVCDYDADDTYATYTNMSGEFTICLYIKNDGAVGTAASYHTNGDTDEYISVEFSGEESTGGDIEIYLKHSSVKTLIDSIPSATHGGGWVRLYISNMPASGITVSYIAGTSPIQVGSVHAFTGTIFFEGMVASFFTDSAQTTVCPSGCYLSRFDCYPFALTEDEMVSENRNYGQYFLGDPPNE